MEECRVVEGGFVQKCNNQCICGEYMGFKESYFNEILRGDESRALSLLNAHDFAPDLREGLFDGPTALSASVQAGKKRLLEELISRGGDVNSSDGVFSPIHLSTDPETLGLLLKAGASVGAGLRAPAGAFEKGSTALHLAAAGGDTSLISVLLKAGADVDARDANGATALHIGAMHDEVVDLLLGAGANIDARTQKNVSAHDLVEHFAKVGPQDIKRAVGLKETNHLPVTPALQSTKEERVEPVMPAQAAPDAALPERAAHDPEQIEGVIRRAGLQAHDIDLVSGERVIEPALDEVAGKSASAEASEQVVIRRADPKTIDVVPTRTDFEGQDSDEIGRIRRAARENQAREETVQPKQPVRTLLGGRFVGDENGNYRRLGETTIAIRDSSNEIVLNDKQIETFLAGLELAKAKGWAAIEVEGSQRFRREAWLRGQQEGMEVVGFLPTPKDLADLAAALERKAADSITPAVAASLDEAKDFLIGKGRGYVTPNYDGGNYAGTVLFESDHHVVVAVDGRSGSATAIEKSRLEGLTVVPGEMLKAKFQDGKLSQSREQSRTMKR